MEIDLELKEKLETLRGEPIQVYTGNPLDIPCIETSDAEKLCKNPVVSVCMITYNHEPYIRQAIDGVMMQKTDFEFELVIGEDCSKDKTREICFEYQKRYPDKIRVLWAEQNVSKLGGNGRRVRAHCRGEFIAFCEGDDYWTDPLKLQKQVDALRKSNAAVCFTDYRSLNESSFELCINSSSFYKPGIIPAELFFRQTIRGGRVGTLTVMMKKSAYFEAVRKFDILSYRLSMGDYQLWIALSILGGACFLCDRTSVHRVTNQGASIRLRSKLRIDSSLVDIYFSFLLYGEKNGIAKRALLKIAEARISSGESLATVVNGLNKITSLGCLKLLSWNRAVYLFGLRFCWEWNLLKEFGLGECWRSLRRHYQRD